MKTRRYSEGQVLRILREVDGGKPVVIAARGMGFPGQRSIGGGTDKAE